MDSSVTVTAAFVAWSEGVTVSIKTPEKVEFCSGKLLPAWAVDAKRPANTLLLQLPPPLMLLLPTALVGVVWCDTTVGLSRSAIPIGHCPNRKQQREGELLSATKSYAFYQKGNRKAEAIIDSFLPIHSWLFCFTSCKCCSDRLPSRNGRKPLESFTITFQFYLVQNPSQKRLLPLFLTLIF